MAYMVIPSSKDAKLLDLSPYQHNSVNITILSLLADTESNVSRLKDITQHFSEKGRSYITDSLSTLSILTFDAVQMFLRAIHGVSYGNNMELNKVTCNNEQTLELGHTIFNYLSSTKWAGLSGFARLEKGNRMDYTINILQLVEHHGLQRLAEYTIEDGAYKQVESTLPSTQAIKFKSLHITAIIEEPFLMLAPNYEKLHGNARFVGFCADLLFEIARDLGFTYEIEICKNCTYGAPDNNGEWDGMVRELMDQGADIALGSFTINYQREQVIDLTKPFMHVGISILYEVSKKETPGLFSFMEPLAVETWFYVILAYVLVSVTLFLLGRFSPYEHVKKTIRSEVDGKDIVIKEFRLSLADGFWFAVGTLMQQGSEVAPAAISTRIAGGFWWFFSLFVISSYTANLAAFLTVERTVMPIENADDLSAQTDIEYGTLINGSTMLFFKESNLEPYQRMWKYMSANPHVFVNSYDEGVERVKNGGYALLMESAALDYRVKKNCETLMQVGGLLDSKGYGIGTPRDSPWRDLMSGAILKIQESGDINEMYERWWNSNRNCNIDPTTTEQLGPHPLDLENVGGIFIILVVGLTLALALALLENLHKKASDSGRICRTDATMQLAM
ncbi:glutamate receptor ionotropic, kainate 2-like [Watersipora subatra]|uniref:glutamate receptor ionotropic, kainate 2-like n=1 Tax=Watersipora subatra TaxID=2589382 RepID=UPI00355B0F39